MKTNRLIAASVAVAGVGAVALTAVAPVALIAAPDTVVPAQSHEIVLAAGFDLSENLAILWDNNGVPFDPEHQDTWVGIKNVPAYANKRWTQLQELLANNKEARAEGGKPMHLFGTTSVKSETGAAVANVLDSVAAIQYVAAELAIPVENAIATVADNADPNLRALVAANNDVAFAIRLVPAYLTLRSAENLHQLVAAVEGGDPKTILKTAVLSNPREMRRMLVGETSEGELGPNSRLGTIQQTSDATRAAARTLVDNQLGKSRAGKAIQKNLVTPARDVAETVRNGVRKAAASVRKEVTKAIENADR